MLRLDTGVIDAEFGIPGERYEVADTGAAEGKNWCVFQKARAAREIEFGSNLSNKLVLFLKFQKAYP
jgi:hypothetical protein